MNKPDCSQCGWCKENVVTAPNLHTLSHVGNYRYRCVHPRSQLGDFSSMESLLERAVVGCPKQTTEWRC